MEVFFNIFLGSSSATLPLPSSTSSVTTDAIPASSTSWAGSCACRGKGTFSWFHGQQLERFPAVHWVQHLRPKRDGSEWKKLLECGNGATARRKRRPIRLSEVVRRSSASDGEEGSAINLSSSSLRKLPLDSLSRSRSTSHSNSNLRLAVSACSTTLFSSNLQCSLEDESSKQQQIQWLPGETDIPATRSKKLGAAEATETGFSSFIHRWHPGKNRTHKLSLPWTQSPGQSYKGALESLVKIFDLTSFYVFLI